MADETDLASEREAMERDRAIAAVRATPHTDLADHICPGCNYATRASWGRTCDGWADCLADHHRRQRAGGIAA